MSVAKFERFFRVAASLDVDKDDLKRFSDFVQRKIYDLLLAAQATAKSNRRDIVRPYDLPLTLGLKENIRAFRRIDEEIEIQPILDYLATRPPLDLALAAETEAELAGVAGGMSVALGNTMKVIDPQVKNPGSEHWERSMRIFEQLL
jgi:hypothetical protein